MCQFPQGNMESKDLSQVSQDFSDCNLVFANSNKCCKKVAVDNQMLYGT